MPQSLLARGSAHQVFAQTFQNRLEYQQVGALIVDEKDVDAGVGGCERDSGRLVLLRHARLSSTLSEFARIDRRAAASRRFSFSRMFSMLVATRQHIRRS